jgi:hypothetical protein
MISAAGIPRIDGDMDALAAHARAISEFGVAFADTGARVNATWQGLAAFYRAPEAGQLLAAMLPVQHVCAAVGEDHRTVGGVLERYAGEVRQIQARLDALRAQADAFEDSAQADEVWADDDAKAERSDELVRAVSVAVADFHDAERRCANAVSALYGGQRYRASDGDGRHERGEYGATAGQFDVAAASEEGVPWGIPTRADGGFLSDIGHGILDVAGLVPVAGEAFDGINAAWYAAEGDMLNAGLSAAAMVPIGGWFATGAKVGIKGTKAATKGADEVGAHSPVAPQGGLRRHENAGGHTLDPGRAHVGASDQQLLDRLSATGNRGSSSYYDRAAAERAASENITGNADEIQRWSQSGDKTARFDWQHDQLTGRYAPRGASGVDDVSDVFGSRIVLRRDPSMPEGYRIQTTFPRP